MPQSRKSQISLVDTPYYHCISRCVRRAYLCGKDTVTGKSYEHRREWVESKLLFLSQVFAIDVCAYAVMSNHTHIVLHVDEAKAQLWSTSEIILRWHKLFKGTLLTQNFVNDVIMTPHELNSVEAIALVYRARLMDISWFMRVLNEGVARQANKEDGCTGRFWEGRFKSQALLDEAAVITCMAYVDLNPIRAKVASTPEASNFTSIKLRAQTRLNHKSSRVLMPFQDPELTLCSNTLPFNLEEYIQLVDLTGRCLHDDKPGFINQRLPNILDRLNICEDNWFIMTKQFTTVFHGAVGTEDVLTEFADHQQRKRRSNLTNSQKLFA